MPFSIEKINALVVENNSSMRQIIISMLRTVGFKSVLVSNSEQKSVDIIQSESIELVVCGWDLPKLDALKLLTNLRSNEKTINIPFIIVSTIIEQALIKKAVSNGVSEYIVPPFNKLILENKINKALKIPIKKTAKNIKSSLTDNRQLAVKHKNKLSILVVDDIADNIEIVRNLLNKDYHVKAALNAKTAERICLSDSPPDIILLDIMMPEVDGLTLCAKLKANPITQNIAIIFLSALSETKDVVKGLALGAVDYITKPIIPEILLARVKVHRSIIKNQRAIQTQIDDLIKHNRFAEKYHQKIKKESSIFTELISEGIAELQQKNSKALFSRPIEQIDYGFSMVKNLINKGELLDNQALENSENNTNNNLHGDDDNVVNSQRLRADKTITELIEPFAYAINTNNLERFEDIPFDIYFYAQGNYFTLLFNALYRNAVEAAPRGSRVSVEVSDLKTFILIKIHNSKQIPQDIEKSFMDLFVSSRPETGTGIGMHVANLICKKIGAQLYYHSSEKYGTTMYLKLKNRKY